jgi:hypothetical protein
MNEHLRGLINSSAFTVKTQCRHYREITRLCRDWRVKLRWNTFFLLPFKYVSYFTGTRGKVEG